MKKLLLFFSLSLIILFGCNNQFKGFEKTESGLLYKIHVSSGDTVKAAIGDVMNLTLYYRTLEDAPVDSTIPTTPFDFQLRESVYQGDLFEGLALLSVGDSATFVVSTDSFFTKLSGAPMPPTLDSGSFFYIDVKVNKITSAAELMRIEEEQRAQAMAQEVALLESYMTSKNITVQPDSNGIYVVMNKKGNGKEVKSGNYAKIQLTINTVQSVMPIYKSSDHIPEGIELLVGTGYFGLGFDLTLPGKKVGDVFTAITPSKMAYGERGMEGIVPPYATLIYDCEILNVYTEDEFNALSKKRNEERVAKQKQDIADYAKKNGFTEKPDNDGIYKKVIKQGAGEPVGNAKGVKVHYTGTLLDGNKFDSSVDRGEPFTFVVGAGEVIPGWDKVVAAMKTGEKAVFIIPSAMGYGSQPAGNIPPHSALVFEIELIGLAK